MSLESEAQSGRAKGRGPRRPEEKETAGGMTAAGAHGRSPGMLLSVGI